VNSAADVLNSPHLRSRDYFVALPVPDDGAVTAPGAPFKLAATPCALRRPAPRLGEHTAEVLNEIGK
jgi:crotonobetainyl-CoA:carnitine CoA-transferase CaiB-like acyl-CoA transferase